MKASYRVSVLQQLRNQLVRFTPRGKKLVQINAAEELLAELVPNRTYSYEYIFFRIAGHRPDAAPHELISGEDAQHDLRMLIEDGFRLGECGCPRRTGTGAHGGTARRNISCFNEDDFSLAQPGTCQSSIHVQRTQAGRFLTEQR